MSGTILRYETMQFAFGGNDWKPWAPADARGEPTLATRKWRPPGSQDAHRDCRGQLIALLYRVSFAYDLMTAKGQLRCCSISGGQERALLVSLSLQPAHYDNYASISLLPGGSKAAIKQYQLDVTSP